MLHPTGGDENLRPGFDNGQLPVGQLTSLRGSCPKGERSESIPPSPPYSKRSSHANAGFFFACCTPVAGRSPLPIPRWRSAYRGYGLCQILAPCLMSGRRPDKRSAIRRCSRSSGGASLTGATVSALLLHLLTA